MDVRDIAKNIDWSSLDKYPESTVYCKCGFVFRSHTKFVASACGIVSKKQCPKCGTHNEFESVRSDPEKMEISNGDGKIRA
jgi:phage FluMu protein Com